MVKVNFSTQPKTDLNISRMGSRENTQSSGSSYLDQLCSKAEEYRSVHKRTYFDNHMVREGSCENALDAISRLFKTSHVVVLGEGSHDELALDAILRAKEGFPSFLKNQGVKTVIVEHVYPIHIEKLTSLEQSELMDHLEQSFGCNKNKAINFLHFLTGCYEKGIKIVPADTREIHKPSGINITRYNATHRIENLNHNILTLYKEEKTRNSGKFLIIVGAAHTNSLNAEASRQSIDKETRNTDPTPGITDVLDKAQEIIVKKYIPDEEGPQEASIKDGCVFRLKIQ